MPYLISISGWDDFTVYLLVNDGGVCVMCPVVPHGALLSAERRAVLESLKPSLNLAKVFSWRSIVRCLLTLNVVEAGGRNA